MEPYIYIAADWPHFRWDVGLVSHKLAGLRHRQGRLLGRMESLSFSLQKDAELQALTEDVIKSSEIEGEHLNADQVRSSVARRLGIDVGGATRADRAVDGVVNMMLNATQHFDQPLSAERLFGWHKSLFPNRDGGGRAIKSGAWRDDATGPMQVVSGPVGKERVHFEAPPAARLDDEMTRFFAWANGCDVATDRTDPVLRAAILHLWFVTIHPFDDGNGRIARAIVDWQLARAEGSAQRFYSMSAAIRAERDAYYAILERTQKGTLDITPWLEWFLACLGHAFTSTETTLGSVLHKVRFWDRHAHVRINDRQRAMLNMLLDGFTGKLTTTKWAALTKCSHDTALRDVQDLIERRMLKKDAAGGRSTSYSVVA